VKTEEKVDSVLNLASKLSLNTALSEIDPSRANGFKVVYNRECPFEIRSQEGHVQSIGDVDLFRCKLLVKENETSLEAFRFELSSDQDLFFYLDHHVKLEDFEEIAKEQRLTLQYQKYPTMLIQMLDGCISEPQTNLAVLTIPKSGSARLDFIKNMEFKFVEVFSCNFLEQGFETVRGRIAFRYEALKYQLKLSEQRVLELEREQRINQIT